MEFCETHFTNRESNWHDTESVECTIIWNGYICLIDFVVAKDSREILMGRSLAREKLMFKTCLRLSVSALRNYCYRHGSFLVVSCVVFLGRFFITTEASYNTLKVAPDLRQLRTSCRLLLETCTATLSENCEIWHVYRYSWETSCAQIGRCHAKSGGSYKG